MTNSKNCDIFSENSNISLTNSVFIFTDISNSKVYLSNGENARIIGDQTVIQAEEFRNMLQYGNSNTIKVQRANDLVWSGSFNQCSLVDSKNVRVFGQENRIEGQHNTDILVCGIRNSLIINENVNLKVRGQRNQVTATRTNNVTVDGTENRVFLSDVNIRHSVRKAKPELVHGFESEVFSENCLDFCGTIARSHVFAGILCPQTHQLVLQNKCTNPNFVQDRKFEFNEHKMPEVRVCYVDQADINKESYNLGIFKVKVEGLACPIAHSPVTIKVISDGFNEGSFKLNIDSTGKTVTYKGSKLRTNQTLKITGNHIIVNDDETISVLFDMFQELEQETDEEKMEE